MIRTAGIEGLDALEEAGCLNQTRRVTSVTITNDGLERAQALTTRYLENTA